MATVRLNPINKKITLILADFLQTKVNAKIQINKLLVVRYVETYIILIGLNKNRIVVWWNGGMLEWWNDGMMEWWNGGMME